MPSRTQEGTAERPGGRGRAGQSGSRDFVRRRAASGLAELTAIFAAVSLTRGSEGLGLHSSARDICPLV